MMNIGFIGAGNMGTAIMKGISTSTLEAEVKLFAFDPCTEKLAALSEYRVSSCSSEKEIMENCKYVFLAVKPQIIEGVLEKCAVSADSEKVFVSIQADLI
jgi:pyrroline-5-carboxylate reductase